MWNDLGTPKFIMLDNEKLRTPSYARDWTLN